MKKHSILTTLFFSFLYFLNAQEIKTQGQVLDIETKTPIPYTNIMLIGHSIGTSSDDNGKFELLVNNINKNTKVVFSNLGYKDFVISLDSLKSIKKVYLKSTPLELDEVLIGLKKTKEDYKLFKLNTFRKNQCDLVYSTKAFEKGESLWVPFRKSEPTIEAIFFPNDFLELSSKVILDKIEVFLSCFSPSAIFRLRIYQPNSHILPDKDLIFLPIQTIFEGNHIITINLLDYDIEMPNEGLFIGLELIMQDDNITNIQNDEGFKTKLQSPYLFFKPIKGEYSFYRYSMGNWKRITEYTPRYSKKGKIKSYKPAVTLHVRKFKQ